MPATILVTQADFTSLAPTVVPNWELLEHELKNAGVPGPFDPLARCGTEWVSGGDLPGPTPVGSPPHPNSWNVSFVDSPTHGAILATVQAHTAEPVFPGIELRRSTVQAVTASLAPIGFDNIAELASVPGLFTWVFGSPVTINKAGWYVYSADVSASRVSGTSTPEVTLMIDGLAIPKRSRSMEVSNTVLDALLDLPYKIVRLEAGQTVTVGVSRAGGAGTSEIQADASLVLLHLKG